MTKLHIILAALLILSTQLASGLSCYSCSYFYSEYVETGGDCKNGAELPEHRVRECLPRGQVLPAGNGTTGTEHTNQQFGCAEVYMEGDIFGANVKVIARSCVAYTSEVGVDGCKEDSLSTWRTRTDEFSQFVSSIFEDGGYSGESVVKGCSCAGDKCNSQLSDGDPLASTTTQRGGGGSDNSDATSSKTFSLGVIFVSVTFVLYRDWI